jgi:hypothetical protein
MDQPNNNDVAAQDDDGLRRAIESSMQQSEAEAEETEAIRVSLVEAEEAEREARILDAVLQASLAEAEEAEREAANFEAALRASLAETEDAEDTEEAEQAAFFCLYFGEARVGESAMEATFSGVTNCPICFDAIEQTKGKSECWTCADCQKSAHTECIKSWFEQSSLCPMCRAEQAGTSVDGHVVHETHLRSDDPEGDAELARRLQEEEEEQEQEQEEYEYQERILANMFILRYILDNPE